ncbi:MAG: PstS family phosphate ABC transporter substrate-binding protein [Actinomycetota bacterium]|nr:PstS family phosphate ABC transporter substrate-binding protein [Actinomycetota bacterium]
MLLTGTRAVCPPRALLPCLALLLTTACAGGTGAAGASSTTLRISGSTTVNPVAADAAEALRGDGLTITVDTQGGSGGGITQLGAGQIDIAMSSKPIGDKDRAAAPDVDYTETLIGQDAVGVVVRKEVIDGGLTSVDKSQLQALFEGRVANWSELGGPDLEVFVYDKEPGRGTREVLDTYLYGKDGKAPAPPDSPRFAIVGGNEETRTKLLSTPGSVAPLSSAFLDGQPQLGLLAVEGVLPTPAAIADKSYALSRPLFFLTDGPPSGAAKTFLDYVLSEKGQQLLPKHGYLTLAQLSS